MTKACEVVYIYQGLIKDYSDIGCSDWAEISKVMYDNWERDKTILAVRRLAVDQYADKKEYWDQLSSGVDRVMWDVRNRLNVLRKGCFNSDDIFKVLEEYDWRALLNWKEEK